MGEEGPSGEAGDNEQPGNHGKESMNLVMMEMEMEIDDGNHGKESMNLAPALEEPCIVRNLKKKCI